MKEREEATETEITNVYFRIVDDVIDAGIGA